MNELLCAWAPYERDLIALPGKSLYSENELESLRQQAICLARTAASAYEKGLVAIGIGDYEEAIVHFGYALALSRSDSMKTAQIFLYKGIAELEICPNPLKRINFIYFGEHSQSQELISCYERALQNIDSSISYHHYLGGAWAVRAFALLNMNRFRQAIQNIDSAMSFGEDDYYVWYIRGYLYGINGNYEASIASFDSSIIRRHNNTETWLVRGLIHSRYHQYDLALASCDSASVFDPNDPEIVRTRKFISHRRFFIGGFIKK
ncbi:MAG: hypothetical protein NT002_04970 [candidate division Zixibacteria bacterium]|nr:hypothetical protein [candidate division Zixibacteria bacterium]